MDEEKTPEEILADRASLAANQGRAQADALHDDFEQRLAGIEAKASAAKQTFANTQSQAVAGGKVAGQTGEEARDLGIGLSIAYAIIGVPIVFFLTGLAIERGTPGGPIQSSLGLIGAVVGVAYAFIAVAKKQRR